jgi:hypothetical protein
MARRLQGISRRGLVVMLALVFGALLTGCAAQSPIQVDSSFWTNQGTKVGIAVAEMPMFSETGEQPANQGVMVSALLNDGAFTGFAKRLEKEDFSRVYKVGGKLENVLRAKGMNTSIVSDPVRIERFPTLSRGDGFAERDYSALAAGAQSQYLLFVRVTRIGMIRSVSILPGAPPGGHFAAVGQLIDLQTQKLLWHKAVDVKRPSQGEWNQPPDFPNLTAALNQAVDSGLNLLVLDFSWTAK